VKTEVIERAWQLPRARIAGLIYLLYFLTAIVAASMAGRGFVLSGKVINLIAYAFYIAVTLLFYALFKPVSKMVSLLAAVVSLAGCAVSVLNLFHVASRVNPLFFFGPYCLLLGYLILRSTFLPRVLGVLLVLAGVGWLMFLWPPVALTLSTYIEVVGIVAEAGLMLWLVARGVNVERWRAQAGLSFEVQPRTDS
jgi:hypothetical protein